jgi:predicted TIM-barrel fold metal-dependent hydrolase
MFTRAWRDLVQEDAVDPATPIIDPHHHLWPGEEPYQGGAYRLPELRQDLESGHNIVATLYLECYANYDEAAPAAFRPVGETAYANGVGEEAERLGLRTRVCHGVISNIDLTAENLEAVLDAHAAAAPERLRGVRQLACWHPDAVGLFDTRPEYYREPRFRRGFARLAARGLTFDACLYHFQLPQLIDLARAFPETTIIVDHFAQPLGVGPFAGRREQSFAELRPLLAEVARCPNVNLKMGGLGMWLTGFGWQDRERPATSDELAHATGKYFHWAIDQFGPDRCMFESNFPVDGAAASYAVTWNAHKKIAARYTPQERSQMFYGVADRVYRLGGPTPRES